MGQQTPTKTMQPLDRPNPHRRNGFSLIELLLVLVVLGILATIVVLTVGGVNDDAQGAGCDADAHLLSVAAEAYFAQSGNTQIAASGTGADRYEQYLVDAQFLRSASTMHDLDADGDLIAVGGSACAA